MNYETVSRDLKHNTVSRKALNRIITDSDWRGERASLTTGL